MILIFKNLFLLFRLIDISVYDYNTMNKTINLKPRHVLDGGPTY